MTHMGSRGQLSFMTHTGVQSESSLSLLYQNMVEGLISLLRGVGGKVFLGCIVVRGEGLAGSLTCL